MGALGSVSAYCPSMRKHRVDERESDNCDIKGAKSKRAKTKASTASSHLVVQDRSLRWACPFYLASPDHFKFSKACAGPGFPEISRLKEHIYRCHSRMTCPRCHASFGGETELTSHILQPKACSLTQETTPDPVTEGIDRAAIGTLRSRKGMPQDETEKWYQIWKIIFPDRQPPASPYMKLGGPSQPSRAEILADFSQYAEEELPRMLRSALKEDYTRSALELADLLPSILRRVIEQYSQRSESEMNPLADEDNRYTRPAQFLPPTPALSLSPSELSSPGTTISGYSPNFMFCTVPDASSPYMDRELFTSGSVCGSPGRICEDESPLQWTGSFANEYDFDSPLAVDNIMANSINLEPIPIELPDVRSSIAFQDFAPPRDTNSRYNRVSSYMSRDETTDVSFVHGYATQMARPLSRYYSKGTGGECQYALSR